VGVRQQVKRVPGEHAWQAQPFNPLAKLGTGTGQANAVAHQYQRALGSSQQSLYPVDVSNAGKVCFGFL
jgi:hypothetical protein